MAKAFASLSKLFARSALFGRVVLGWAPLCSENQGLPLPLGRGVREAKSKNGRSRPRKPFIFGVFCAQRGIETMVLEGA